MEEVLRSPAANEDSIGCGPKEKEELIELRFLEVAVDGRRGATWMAKLPSGGGVEAISMYKSMILGAPESCRQSRERVTRHVTTIEKLLETKWSLDKRVLNNMQ